MGERTMCNPSSGTGDSTGDAGGAPGGLGVGGAGPRSGGGGGGRRNRWACGCRRGATLRRRWRRRVYGKKAGVVRSRDDRLTTAPDFHLDVAALQFELGDVLLD